MTREVFESLPVGSIVYNLGHMSEVHIIEQENEKLVQFAPFNENAAVASIFHWSDAAIAGATLGQTTDDVGSLLVQLLKLLHVVQVDATNLSNIKISIANQKFTIRIFRN